VCRHTGAHAAAASAAEMDSSPGWIVPMEISRFVNGNFVYFAKLQDFKDF
jgi:hypothetical protein